MVEPEIDYDAIKADVEHACVGLRRPAQMFLQGASRATSAHIADWAEVRVQRGLSRLYDRVVSYLNTNSEMPSTLASVCVSILDRAWQELREPVSEYLAEEFGKVIGARKYADFDDTSSVQAGAAPCSVFSRIRGHILRTFYPHDLSLWRMIRNPWWWLQALLSIFPFYGVSSLYWIGLFVLIDRSDECTYYARHPLIERVSVLAAAEAPCLFLSRLQISCACTFATSNR